MFFALRSFERLLKILSPSSWSTIFLFCSSKKSDHMMGEIIIVLIYKVDFFNFIISLIFVIYRCEIMNESLFLMNIWWEKCIFFNFIILFFIQPEYNYFVSYEEVILGLTNDFLGDTVLFHDNNSISPRNEANRRVYAEWSSRNNETGLVCI